jgi:hypothetical protein
MPRRSPIRWLSRPRSAWQWSFALHAALVGWGVQEWLSGAQPTPGEFGASGRQVLLVAAPLHEPSVAEVVLQRWPETKVTSDETLPAVDAEEVLARMVDPRWQTLVEPASESAGERGEGTFVTAELMRIARAAEQRSTDENLEKLEELSQRLATVSSAGAVEDINSQLRRVLRAGERADRPAEEPVAGDFDFATAQLHDVLREANEAGQWQFTAILVDSAGRKFESPLDPTAGESAYRTMRLIKSNPLLEKVYRGVVMSMLDQVLQGLK